jgi:hypothetical protein
MMIEKSVVNIAKYPERPLLRAVEGKLAEIIHKTKTRLMKIGRHEGTPICCTCVTVKVSL